MKAFLMALGALIIITVGSNAVLTELGFSADESTVSDANVRLPD